MREIQSIDNISKISYNSYIVRYFSLFMCGWCVMLSKNKKSFAVLSGTLLFSGIAPNIASQASFGTTVATTGQALKALLSGGVLRQ